MLKLKLPHSFRYIKRTALHARNTACVAVALFISGCGGQVKNKQELIGTFENWDVKIPQVTDTILPRKDLEKPLVFELRDKSGNPITDLPVDVVLLPYDMNADKLQSKDQAALGQLWNTVRGNQGSAGTNQNSGNSETTTDNEDLVGRITKWDTRSGSDGSVRVWLKSPSEFNKSVAILLRVGDAGFEYYTFATYKTADYSSGAKLGVRFQKYESCEPTAELTEIEWNDAAKTIPKRSTTVTAGDCFAPIIEILEDDGISEKVYKQFNGSRKLNIQASPGASWGQVQPDFMQPQVTCQFNNGACVLPIQARLVKAEEFPLKISFNEPGNPKDFDGTVTVRPNKVKFALLPRTPDGKSVRTVNIKAGDEISLTAVWVDSAGEKIEDAAGATWSMSNEALKIGTDLTGTPKTIIFKPVKTGEAEIALSAEGKQEFAPILAKIPAGPFVQWAVRVNGRYEQDPSQPITSGVCVGIDVFAADANFNVNNTIEDEVSLELNIVGAESGPQLAQKAHFGEQVSLGTKIIKNNLKFNAGEANGIEKACFFDATAVTPTITVSSTQDEQKHKNITGTSQVLNVVSGPEHHLALVYDHASNTNADPTHPEIKHACFTHAPEEYGSITEPCIVSNIQGSANEATAGTTNAGTLNLKAALLDAAGNVKRFVASEWKEKGTTAGQIFENHLSHTLSEGYAQIASGSPLMLKRDKASAVTLLEGRLADSETTIAEKKTVTYSFSVVPSTPVSARVFLCRPATDANNQPTCLKDAEQPVDDRLNDNTSVRAGVPYGVVVELLDSSDTNPNIVDSQGEVFQGYLRKRPYSPTAQVQIQLLNAGDSPTGFQAIPAPPVDGSYPFEIPAAEFKSGIARVRPDTSQNSAHFKLALATVGTALTKPTLTGVVSINANTLTIRSSSLNVYPNFPANFKLVDEQRKDVGFYQPNVKYAFQTFIPASFSVAGFDSLGNYYGDLSSTFTWTPDNLLSKGSCADPNDATKTITSAIIEGGGFVQVKSASTSVTLQSPCALQGTFSIQPATVYTEMSTWDSAFSTKMSPFIDIVGKVAHHFVIDAVVPGDEYGPPLDELDAAQTFKVRVRPVSLDGSPAEGYNGNKTLLLTGLQLQSWGGATGLSSLPSTDGEFTSCDFVPNTTIKVPSQGGGYSDLQSAVCILHGAGGTGYKSVTSVANGNLINIKDKTVGSTLDQNFQNNLTISVNPGEPAKLVISNACGGPTQGAKIWTEEQQNSTLRDDKKVLRDAGGNAYIVSADDTIKLVPALTDAQGNYIKDAVSPTINIVAGSGANAAAQAYIQPSHYSSVTNNNCTEFTLTPKKASDNTTIKNLSSTNTDKVKFEQPNLADPSAPFIHTIPLAVKPGKPNSIAVQTPRIAQGIAPNLNEIRPGECADIVATARDQHSNQVFDYAKTVEVDLKVNNYYHKSSANEQTVMPGGLFIDYGNAGRWAVHSSSPGFVGASYSQWTNLSAENQFVTSDPTGKTTTYYGHEKRTANFVNGKLDLGRIFCVFDATPSQSGQGPNVDLVINGGELSGSSSPLTVVANTASAFIDVRENKSDGKRLCTIPSGSLDWRQANKTGPDSNESGFPKLQTDGVVFSWDKAANESNCNFFEVSGAALEYKLVGVDRVGNIVNDGAATSLTSLTSSPLNTVSSSSGNSFTFVTSGQTGLQKTGTLKANHTLGTLSRLVEIRAIATVPRYFSFFVANPINNTTNRVDTENPFDLLFELEDQFHNPIDNLPGFQENTSVAFEFPDAGNGAADASAVLLADALYPNNSKPNPLASKPDGALSLSFSGSNTQSTFSVSPNSFHFKKANNGLARIKATMTFSNNVTDTKTIDLTVVPGAVFATSLAYQKNGTKTLMDPEQVTQFNSADKEIDFRTVSYDIYGNQQAISISVTPSCNTEFLVCAADAATPGRFIASIIKAGQSVVTSGGNVIPSYPVKVLPSAPSGLRLTRVGGNAATTILTAGDEIQFEVRIVDQFDNVVPNTEKRQIEWSIANSYPEIPDGGDRVELPASADCNFVDGLCGTTYTLKVRGAVSIGGNINAAATAYDANNVLDAGNKLTGSSQVRVKTAALSHFSTAVSAAIAEARRDYNTLSKFSVTVSARDQFGNKVKFVDLSNNATGLQNKVVNLKIVRPDGTAVAYAAQNNNAVGFITGVNNGVPVRVLGSQTFSATDTVVFSDIAYDEPGDFKLIAEENNLTTPLSAAAQIKLKPVLHSIKEFSIDLPAALTLTAGVQQTLPVTARSFYNQPIKGLDVTLNNSVNGQSFSFAWDSTLLSNQTHNGVSIPSSFSFTDGVAFVPITLVNTTNTTDITNQFKFKGQLNINNNLEYEINSALPQNSVVKLAPHDIAKYTINLNNLPGTPLATLASRFDIEVKALDQYGNQRPGQAGLSLLANVKNDSNLAGFTSKTTILRKPTNTAFPATFDANFSPSEIDLSQGAFSATGISYLVPQTIQLTLSGTTIPIERTPEYVTFAADIATVKNYSIDITETDDVNTTGTLRTHGNTDVRVIARDIEGNALHSIDAALNGLSFNFSGANSLAVPSTQTPDYPVVNTNGAFSNGVWDTYISFKTTQTFQAGNLTVTDTFASGARSGANTNAFTVYSRHKDYVINAGGTNVAWNAGSAAQVQVIARGHDHLPVREYDAPLNALKFSWAGLSNAPDNTAPLFDNSANRSDRTLSFENGIATLEIVASKAETVSNANLTITDENNLAGSLSGTVTVNAGSVVYYELESNQSSRDADSTSNGLFQLKVRPQDQFKNPTRGELGVAITAIDGNKTKTTLKSTQNGFNSLAVDLINGLDAAGWKVFDNVYYDVPDTGIRFTLSGSNVNTNNITPTAAMSFSATVRSIVKYKATFPNQATAGNAFSVSLKPLDIAGNELAALKDASELASLNSLRFNLAGPQNALNGTAPTPEVKQVKDIPISFDANLDASLSLTLVRAETIAAGGVVLEDNHSPVRQGTNDNAVTIIANAPSVLVAGEIPDKKANEEFEVAAYLRDSLGNSSFSGCNGAGLYSVVGWFDGSNFLEGASDVSASGVFKTSNGVPEVKSLADTAVNNNATVLPDSANGNVMKLKVKLFKKGQNRLRLLACGMEKPLIVNVTEAPMVALAQISTSAQRPTALNSLTEAQCFHSNNDLTSPDVICPTLYAYFWDPYGNTHSDGTGQCNWTAAKAFANNSDDYLPAVSGASATKQITHSKPINANVTCTSTNNANVSSSVLIYGGVSQWSAEFIPNQNKDANGILVDKTAFTAGSDTDMDGKTGAVGTPLYIQNIQTKILKGATDQLVNYSAPTASSHTVTFATTDSDGNSINAAGVPASLTTNLTASGAMPANENLAIPVQAPQANMKLSVTLRGKTATLIKLSVNTGAAESIALQTAHPVRVAGSAATEVIEVRDPQGLLANCTGITVSVLETGSRDAPANGSTVPGTPSSFATVNANSLGTITTATPGLFSLPFTFFKAETVTLQFTTIQSDCGATKTVQQTYTIGAKEDAEMLARLSTADALAPAQHTEQLTCDMGAGSAIACQTLFLHVWDKYGNYLSGKTCDDNGWAWESYDNGNNGTTETPALTAGLQRKQTLTSDGSNSGFLDGRLLCTRAGTAINRSGTTAFDANFNSGIRTHIIGGMKELTVVNSKNANPVTNLIAAANNLTIDSITAKWRDKGSISAKSDFNSANIETITLTTSVAAGATQSEIDRTLTGGDYPISTTTTIECKFAADGVCKDQSSNTKTLPLSFQLVESKARTVALNLRGKTVSLTVNPIGAAAAAHVALATDTAELTAGQSFKLTATLSDAFGNRTNKLANGNTCASSDISAKMIHVNPVSADTSLSTADSFSTAGAGMLGGVAEFTNRTTNKAGSKTISVTACGLTEKTLPFSVIPDAVDRVALSTNATGSETHLGEARCPLALNGSGAVCPALYATVLDQFNNRISGKTCNWTWSDNSDAKTNFPDMSSPTLSAMSGTTNTMVTHTDFFDGTLKCTLADDNNKFANTQLYGGIARVDLAWVAKTRDADGNEDPVNNGKVVVAGNDNILLNSASSIKLQAPVKGTTTDVPMGAADIVAGASAILPITFTSTETAAALPANKTESCDFTNGTCTGKSYSFNFKQANVGGTKYQASVSIRGKTATIPDIEVLPANAAKLVLTAKVNGAAVSAVTTDTQFNVEALVKDQFDNLTDLGADYKACPAPDANNTTVYTSGVQAKPNATPDTSLSAASRVPAKVANTTGTYQFSNFQLLGIQADGSNATSTLKFKICGVDKDDNNAAVSALQLTVQAGAPKSVVLTNDNSNKLNAVSEMKCPLNANGAGVTCSAIYAYLYDANSNLISGSDGRCTSWSAAHIPNNSPAGLVAPAFNSSASAIQNITSSGAISSTLTCNHTANGFSPSSIKIYGGIAQLELDWDGKSLGNDNTPVTNSKAVALNAQDNNLTIKSIKFKSFDANGNSIDLNEGLSNESVSFATNASSGPTDVNPIANATVSCDMSNNGACTSQHTFTFNKAGETDRALHVDIRTIRASITGISVAPGSYDAATNSIPTTGTVDAAITAGSIAITDKFGNRTSSIGNQKDCSTLSIAYQYAADATNFSAADPNNNVKAPDGVQPTLPAALTVNNAVKGQYDLPASLATALKLVKPGTYKLLPTACGASLAAHTVAVTTGSTAIVKLFDSAQNSPWTETATTGPILCPHTNDGNGNIACPTIHAYFFDSRGNEKTSDQCSTWTFVKNSNSNDSAVPNFANANSATTTLTATDWIDGTLVCNKGNTAELKPQLTMYGGTEKITADFSTTTPTASASQNVTLNSVTIYQRKLGNSVPVASARAGEVIGIATTAQKATQGSPAQVIAGNATSYSCNSAANTGVCTGSAPAITLSKAENATVTLTLRGKSAVTNFTTQPATATNATLTLGTASPWTAGTAYSADFIPKDDFGNPSTSGCTSVVGSGGALSATTQIPSYGTVGAWADKYPITGITLHDASSQVLAFTCNNSVSAQQTITVNPGSKTKISISTSTTKPSYANAQLATEIKCTLASGDNSNTTLTCPTVYAWGYDSYGNTTADNDCLWQKSEWTGAAFGTASNADGNTAKASFTPQHSGTPLNAKLSCGNAGIALLNTNNIYGGVEKITLALAQANTQSTDANGINTYTTTATNIKAAPSNVIISQINAYSKRENTLVPVPGIGAAQLNFTFTVTDIENQANVEIPSAQCTFENETSQCSTALAFTFKKVHSTAATRPKIELDIKGKKAKVSVSPIVGGNGATLQITNGWPANDTTQVGQAFTPSLQVYDQYNNLASTSPNGNNCDGALNVSGFVTGVYPNTITTPATAGGGVYQMTANILKAANHNVTLAACGLSLSKALETTVGAFDRALITTSNTAPTYTCTNGDVCETAIPTCTAKNTAECGPFYVWQFDQGGNLVNNTPSDCGTNQNGIQTTKDGDSDNLVLNTSTNPHSFTVKAASAGKHIAGSFHCSSVGKGTKIIFKAPTLVRPGFKCFPYGIDNTGNLEGTCIVSNETGYTLSAVNFKRCTAAGAAGTYCGSFGSDQSINDFSVSSHCFNLVSKENVTTQMLGHKCSIIVSGSDNKYSPVMWVEGVSPDDTKVQFEASRPVRIPKFNDWIGADPNNPLNGTVQNPATDTNMQTCAAGTYTRSQAAACDKNAYADKIDVSGAGGLKAPYFDGKGTARDCSNQNTNREFKVTYTANNDPAAFATSTAGTNDFVLDLDTEDGVTIDHSHSETTCDSGLDLATNGVCTMRIQSAGPFFEGVFLIKPNFIVRTSESPICKDDGF